MRASAFHFVENSVKRKVVSVEFEIISYHFDDATKRNKFINVFFCFLRRNIVLVRLFVNITYVMLFKVLAAHICVRLHIRCI